MPVLFSPTTRSSARDSLSGMQSNGTPMAKTPPGNAMSGAGAAELLQGMLMGASSTAPEEEANRVSRKDKSLGLLCDNFLQLFACGFSATVELEPVANRLGVGRRRIYDIVNVLESLDVVQKDRASSYTWFGLTQLPRCVVQLEAVSAGASAVKLLPDCPLENTADAGGRRGGRDEDEHDCGGRKEKSIKELSVKFVGLFLQSVKRSGADGVLSLDQAARSLLVHQAGGARATLTATILTTALTAPTLAPTLMSPTMSASVAAPTLATAAVVAPSLPATLPTSASSAHLSLLHRRRRQVRRASPTLPR